MPRLATTNPELFENPTLGEANPLPFLEEVEAQRVEDRNARFEKREPGIAVRDVRYPQLPPSGTVPSTVANTVTVVSPEDAPVSESEEFTINFDEDE